MAQINVNVSGTVTDENNPVPDYSVYINLFGMDSTTLINDVVVTDESGFYDYAETIEQFVGDGVILEVGTFDCNMDYISYRFILTPNNSTVIQDFEICTGTPNDCEAYYTYSQVGDFSIQFMNQSTGEDLIYFWSFGDGSGSDEENPLHTFGSNGAYPVSLTIMNNDSSCFDFYEDIVIVGDSMPGDCYAYFTYTDLGQFTIEFLNLSQGNDLIYFWNFGGDNWSDEENPVHDFGSSGAYPVSLTIMNNDSSCFDFYEDIVIVGDSMPGDCEAAFTYDQPGDITGLTYLFIDMSFGYPTFWHWDFGDGTNSSEQNPMHTFSEAGIYDVCLTISSQDSSCFDVYCESIVVDDSSTCIAQYTYFPDSSLSDYTLQFIDLSYGNIGSWYWDFGDGTYSEEQDPVHTFSEEGYYYVCLTIVGENCQSVWCEEVYVGPYEDCFNYFTYEAAGNSVLFEGFHSGLGPASYYWEFGDGTSGEGQVVSHTYATTGTYFVSLSTFEGDICSATSSQVIVVGDSIEYNQIYGQVFEGDFPLEEGFVMIFSMDTDSNYIPFFDISMIDSSGIYVFPYVPNGEFAVYAIPFYFNGYMPTYYGDVVNWDEATPIVLGDPNNPYDIHLVPVDAPTYPGNGTITGIISDPAVREGFINKIKILLYNENYELIDFTNVDSEGSFNISNLANGTYYIYPELTGVTSSFMRVDISDEQQEVVVNMTMNGNSILGNKEMFTITEAGDIFPNPADRNARVELTNQKTTVVTVQVLDITGRNYSITEYNLNAGRSVIDIPMENLQTGLYFVRISNTEGNVITKKVIRQ